ncbi:MAG TPA: ElyC/SanA/YdcF family protein, partial [Candidatus Omnitrophota bacterium]|nr:ElyC/SanA/YdcF family protein [Candidatus Omnitrophota bacterium]
SGGVYPSPDPVTYPIRSALAHAGSWLKDHAGVVGKGGDAILGLVNSVIGGDPRTTWDQMQKLQKLAEQQRIQFDYFIRSERVELKNLTKYHDYYSQRIALLQIKRETIDREQQHSSWWRMYQAGLFGYYSADENFEYSRGRIDLELNELQWARTKVEEEIRRRGWSTVEHARTSVNQNGLSAKLHADVQSVKTAVAAAAQADQQFSVTAYQETRRTAANAIEVALQRNQAEMDRESVRLLSSSVLDVLPDATIGSNLSVGFSNSFDYIKNLEDFFAPTLVWTVNINLMDLAGQLQRLRLSKARAEEQGLQTEFYAQQHEVARKLVTYLQAKMTLEDYREMQKTRAGRLLLKSQARLRHAADVTEGDVLIAERLVNQAEEDEKTAQIELELAQSEFNSKFNVQLDLKKLTDQQGQDLMTLMNSLMVSIQESGDVRQSPELKEIRERLANQRAVLTRTWGEKAAMYLQVTLSENYTGPVAKIGGSWVVWGSGNIARILMAKKDIEMSKVQEEAHQVAQILEKQNVMAQAQHSQRKMIMALERVQMHQAILEGIFDKMDREAMVAGTAATFLDNTKKAFDAYSQAKAELVKEYFDLVQLAVDLGLPEDTFLMGEDRGSEGDSRAPPVLSEEFERLQKQPSPIPYQPPIEMAPAVPEELISFEKVQNPEIQSEVDALVNLFKVEDQDAGKIEKAKQEAVDAEKQSGEKMAVAKKAAAELQKNLDDSIEALNEIQTLRAAVEQAKTDAQKLQKDRLALLRELRAKDAVAEAALAKSQNAFQRLWGWIFGGEARKAADLKKEEKYLKDEQVVQLDKQIKDLEEGIKKKELEITILAEKSQKLQSEFQVKQKAAADAQTAADAARRDASQKKAAVDAMIADHENFLRAKNLLANIFEVYAAKHKIPVKPWAQTLVALWADAQQKGLLANGYLGSLVAKDEKLGNLWANIEKSVSLTDKSKKQLELMGIDLKLLHFFGRFALMSQMLETNPYFMGLMEKMGNPSREQLVAKWSEVMRAMWDAKKAAEDSRSWYGWQHSINDSGDWILFVWALRFVEEKEKTKNPALKLDAAYMNDQRRIDEVHNAAKNFTQDNFAFLVEFHWVDPEVVHRGVELARRAYGLAVMGDQAAFPNDIDNNLDQASGITAWLEDSFRRNVWGEVVGIEEKIKSLETLQKTRVLTPEEQDQLEKLRAQHKLAVHRVQDQELARAQKLHELVEVIRNPEVFGEPPLELMNSRIVRAWQAIDKKFSEVQAQLGRTDLSPETRAALEKNLVELGVERTELEKRKNAEIAKFKQAGPLGMAIAILRQTEGYQFDDREEREEFLKEKSPEVRFNDVVRLIRVSANLYHVFKENGIRSDLNPWDSSGKSSGWLMGRAQDVIEDYETWQEMFDQDGKVKDVEKVRAFFNEPDGDYSQIKRNPQVIGFARELLGIAPQLRFGTEQEDFIDAVAFGFAKHKLLNPLITQAQIGRLAQRMREFLQDPVKVQQVIGQSERELHALYPGKGADAKFQFTRRTDMGIFMSFLLNAAEEGYGQFLWKDERVLEILEKDPQTVSAVIDLANRVRAARGIDERITRESISQRRFHRGEIMGYLFNLVSENPERFLNKLNDALGLLKDNSTYEGKTPLQWAVALANQREEAISGRQGRFQPVFQPVSEETFLTNKIQWNRVFAELVGMADKEGVKKWVDISRVTLERLSDPQKRRAGMEHAQKYFDALYGAGVYHLVNENVFNESLEENEDFKTDRILRGQVLGWFGASAEEGQRDSSWISWLQKSDEAVRRLEDPQQRAVLLDEAQRLYTAINPNLNMSFSGDNLVVSPHVQALAINWLMTRIDGGWDQTGNLANRLIYLIKDRPTLLKLLDESKTIEQLLVEGSQRDFSESAFRQDLGKVQGRVLSWMVSRLVDGFELTEGLADRLKSFMSKKENRDNLLWVGERVKFLQQFDGNISEINPANFASPLDLDDREDRGIVLGSLMNQLLDRGEEQAARDFEQARTLLVSRSFLDYLAPDLEADRLLLQDTAMNRKEKALRLRMPGQIGYWMGKGSDELRKGLKPDDVLGYRENFFSAVNENRQNTDYQAIAASRRTNDEKLRQEQQVNEKLLSARDRNERKRIMAEYSVLATAGGMETSWARTRLRFSNHLKDLMEQDVQAETKKAMDAFFKYLREIRQEPILQDYFKELDQKDPSYADSIAGSLALQRHAGGLSDQEYKKIAVYIAQSAKDLKATMGGDVMPPSIVMDFARKMLFDPGIDYAKYLKTRHHEYEKLAWNVPWRTHRVIKELYQSLMGRELVEVGAEDAYQLMLEAGADQELSRLAGRFIDMNGKLSIDSVELKGVVEDIESRIAQIENLEQRAKIREQFRHIRLHREDKNILLSFVQMRKHAAQNGMTLPRIVEEFIQTNPQYLRIKERADYEDRVALDFKEKRIMQAAQLTEDHLPQAAESQRKVLLWSSIIVVSVFSFAIIVLSNISKILGARARPAFKALLERFQELIKLIPKLDPSKPEENKRLVALNKEQKSVRTAINASLNDSFNDWKRLSSELTKLRKEAGTEPSDEFTKKIEELDKKVAGAEQNLAQMFKDLESTEAGFIAQKVKALDLEKLKAFGLLSGAGAIFLASMTAIILGVFSVVSFPIILLVGLAELLPFVGVAVFKLAANLRGLTDFQNYLRKKYSIGTEGGISGEGPGVGRPSEPSARSELRGESAPIFLPSLKTIEKRLAKDPNYATEENFEPFRKVLAGEDEKFRKMHQTIERVTEGPTNKISRVANWLGNAAFFFGGIYVLSLAVGACLFLLVILPIELVSLNGHEVPAWVGTWLGFWWEGLIAFFIGIMNEGNDHPFLKLPAHVATKLGAIFSSFYYKRLLKAIKALDLFGERNSDFYNKKHVHLAMTHASLINENDLFVFLNKALQWGFSGKTLKESFEIFKRFQSIFRTRTDAFDLFAQASRRLNAGEKWEEVKVFLVESLRKIKWVPVEISEINGIVEAIRINRGNASEENLAVILSTLGDRRARAFTLEALPAFVEANKAAFSEANLLKVLDHASRSSGDYKNVALDVLPFFIQANKSAFSESNFKKILVKLSNKDYELTVAAVEVLPLFIQANAAYATESNLSKVLDACLHDETGTVAHYAAESLPAFIQANKEAFSKTGFSKVLNALRDSDEAQRRIALKVLPVFIQADYSYATETILKEVLDIQRELGFRFRDEELRLSVLPFFIQANKNAFSEALFSEVKMYFFANTPREDNSEVEQFAARQRQSYALKVLTYFVQADERFAPRVAALQRSDSSDIEEQASPDAEEQTNIEHFSDQDHAQRVFLEIWKLIETQRKAAELENERRDRLLAEFEDAIKAGDWVRDDMSGYADLDATKAAWNYDEISTHVEYSSRLDQERMTQAFRFLNQARSWHFSELQFKDFMEFLGRFASNYSERYADAMDLLDQISMQIMKEKLSDADAVSLARTRFAQLFEQAKAHKAPGTQGSDTGEARSELRGKKLEEMQAGAKKIFDNALWPWLKPIKFIWLPIVKPAVFLGSAFFFLGKQITTGFFTPSELSWKERLYAYAGIGIMLFGVVVLAHSVLAMAATVAGAVSAYQVLLALNPLLWHNALGAAILGAGVAVWLKGVFGKGKQDIEDIYNNPFYKKDVQKIIPRFNALWAKAYKVPEKINGIDVTKSGEGQDLSPEHFLYMKEFIKRNTTADWKTLVYFGFLAGVVAFYAANFIAITDWSITNLFFTLPKVILYPLLVVNIVRMGILFTLGLFRRETHVRIDPKVLLEGGLGEDQKTAIIYPAKSENTASSWESLLNLFRSFTGESIDDINVEELEKELVHSEVGERAAIYIKWLKDALGEKAGQIKGVDHNHNLYAVHVQIGSNIDIAEFEASLVNGMREFLDPAWRSQWGFVRASDSAPRAKTGVYHDLMEVFTLGNDRPVAYQEGTSKFKMDHDLKLEDFKTKALLQNRTSDQIILDVLKMDVDALKDLSLKQLIDALNSVLEMPDFYQRVKAQIAQQIEDVSKEIEKEALEKKKEIETEALKKKEEIETDKKITQADQTKKLKKLQDDTAQKLKNLQDDTAKKLKGLDKQKAVLEGLQAEADKASPRNKLEIIKLNMACLKMIYVSEIGEFPGLRTTSAIFKIDPEGYRFDAPFADNKENPKAKDITVQSKVSTARLRKVVEENKYVVRDPETGEVIKNTKALLAMEDKDLRDLLYKNIKERVTHFATVAKKSQGGDYGEMLLQIGKSPQPGAFTLLSDPDNAWMPLDLDILKRYLMEFIYAYEGKTPSVLIARLFGRRAPPDLDEYKKLLAQVIEMQSRGEKYYPGGNTLLNIALLAANPEHAIVEAALEIGNPEDTLDNSLEQQARRELSSGSDTEAAILGRWGFFGKGGIQNYSYIIHVLFKMKIFLGNLSHDTMEAPWLRPLYVSFLKQSEGGILNRLALYFKQSRWALGEFANTFKEHEWFKDTVTFYWKTLLPYLKDVTGDIADQKNIVKAVEGAIGLSPEQISGPNQVSLEELKAALEKSKKFKITKKIPDPTNPGKQKDKEIHTSKSLLARIERNRSELRAEGQTAEKEAPLTEEELRKILFDEVSKRVKAEIDKSNKAPLGKPLVTSEHKHREKMSLGAFWLVIQPFIGPLVSFGFFAYLLLEWGSSAWPGGVEMGVPSLAALSMLITVGLLITTGKIFDVFRHLILSARNLARAVMSSGHNRREWLGFAWSDLKEAGRGVLRAPKELRWSTGLLLQNVILEIRLQWSTLSKLFLEAKGVWIPQAFVESMLVSATLIQYLYLFWPAVMFYFAIQLFVVAVFPIGGMVYLAMQLATYTIFASLAAASVFSYLSGRKSFAGWLNFAREWRDGKAPSWFGARGEKPKGWWSAFRNDEGYAKDYQQAWNGPKELFKTMSGTIGTWVYTFPYSRVLIGLGILLPTVIASVLGFTSMLTFGFVFWNVVLGLSLIFLPVLVRTLEHIDYRIYTHKGIGKTFWGVVRGLFLGLILMSAAIPSPEIHTPFKVGYHIEEIQAIGSAFFTTVVRSVNNTFANGGIGRLISAQLWNPSKPELTEAEKMQVKKYELLVGEASETLDRIDFEDEISARKDRLAVENFNKSQGRVTLEVNTAAREVIYVPDFLKAFRSAVEKSGISTNAHVPVVIDYSREKFQSRWEGSKFHINAAEIERIPTETEWQNILSTRDQAPKIPARSEMRSFEERVKLTGRMTFVLTGLSRSGKSTAGRLGAMRVGGVAFSAGEIFRAATYVALAEKIPLENPDSAALLAEVLQKKLSWRIGANDVEFLYERKPLKTELESVEVVQNLRKVSPFIAKSYADHIFFQIVRAIERSGKHLFLDSKRGISEAIAAHTDIEVHFTASEEVRAQRAFDAAIRFDSLKSLYEKLRAPSDESWESLLHRVGAKGVKQRVYEMVLAANNARDKADDQFRKKMVQLPRRIEIDTSQLGHREVQSVLNGKLAELMSLLESDSEDKEFQAEIQEIRQRDFSGVPAFDVLTETITQNPDKIVNLVLDALEAPEGLVPEATTTPDPLLISRQEFSDRALALLGFEGTPEQRQALSRQLENVWDGFLDKQIALSRKIVEDVERKALEASKTFIQFQSKNTKEYNEIIEKYQFAANLCERLIAASQFDSAFITLHQRILQELEQFYANSSIPDGRSHFLVLVPTTNRPSSLKKFFQSALDERQAYHYSRVTYVIIENSEFEYDREENEQTIAAFRKAGLKIDYWGLERQQVLIRSMKEKHPELFLEEFLQSSTPRDITNVRFMSFKTVYGSREMTRFAAQELIAGMPKNTLIWQVDDDQIFAATSLNKKGGVIETKAFSTFHRALQLLNSTQADVVLGAVDWDPAVPPSSFIYGQMVDLVHFFERAKDRQPGDDAMEGLPDIRDYAHPESNIDFNGLRGDRDEIAAHPRPVLAEPGEKLGDLFNRYLLVIDHIFTGTPLTRPLLYHPMTAHYDTQTQEMIPFTMDNPYFSGGNTLYRNHHFLTDIPYFLSAKRRGDSLFTYALRQFGASIVLTPLPFTHHRGREFRENVLFERGKKVDWGEELIGEFEGYVIQKIYAFLFNRYQVTDPEGLARALQEASVPELVELYKKLLKERWNVYEKAMIGVRKMLEEINAKGYLEDTKYWWNQDGAVFQGSIDHLKWFLKQVAGNFTLESAAVSSLAKKVHHPDPAEIERKVRELLNFRVSMEHWKAIMDARREVLAAKQDLLTLLGARSEMREVPEFILKHALRDAAEKFPQYMPVWSVLKEIYGMSGQEQMKRMEHLQDVRMLAEANEHLKALMIEQFNSYFGKEFFESSREKTSAVSVYEIQSFFDYLAGVNPASVIPISVAVEGETGELLSKVMIPIAEEWIKRYPDMLYQYLAARVYNRIHLKFLTARSAIIRTQDPDLSDRLVTQITKAYEQSDLSLRTKRDSRNPDERYEIIAGHDGFAEEQREVETALSSVSVQPRANQEGIFVGLDIGGNTIKVVIVEGGSIKYKETVPSVAVPVDVGELDVYEDAVFAKIKKLLQQIQKQVLQTEKTARPILGVGITSKGYVDENGNASRLFPTLSQRIEGELNVPVVLRNDSKSHAAWLVGAKGVADAVSLALGTHVGSEFIWDHQLSEDQPELAFLVYGLGAKLKRVTDSASLEFLVSQAKQQSIHKGKGEITGVDIARALKAGDERTDKMILEYSDAIAELIRGTVYETGFDHFYLSGGLASENLGKRILEEVLRALKKMQPRLDVKVELIQPRYVEPQFAAAVGVAMVAAGAVMAMKRSEVRMQQSTLEDLVARGASPNEIEDAIQQYHREIPETAIAAFGNALSHAKQLGIYELWKEARKVSAAFLLTDIDELGRPETAFAHVDKVVRFADELEKHAKGSVSSDQLYAFMMERKRKPDVVLDREKVMRVTQLYGSLRRSPRLLALTYLGIIFHDFGKVLNAGDDSFASERLTRDFLKRLVASGHMTEAEATFVVALTRLHTDIGSFNYYQSSPRIIETYIHQNNIAPSTFLEASMILYLADNGGAYAGTIDNDTLDNVLWLSKPDKLSALAQYPFGLYDFYLRYVVQHGLINLSKYDPKSFNVAEAYKDSQGILDEWEAVKAVGDEASFLRFQDVFLTYFPRIRKVAVSPSSGTLVKYLYLMTKISEWLEKQPGGEWPQNIIWPTRNVKPDDALEFFKAVFGNVSIRDIKQLTEAPDMSLEKIKQNFHIAMKKSRSGIIVEFPPPGFSAARSELRTENLSRLVTAMAKRDVLPEKVGGIVIFGSSSKRITPEAARFYKEGKAPWILVSGRFGKTVPEVEGQNYGRMPDGSMVQPEALVFKKELMDLGVPEEAILVEDRSQDMTQNAEKTVALLQTRGLNPETVILMHGPYHVLRGAQEFRRALQKAGMTTRLYEYAGYVPDVATASEAERAKIEKTALAQVQKLNSDVPEIPELAGINGLRDQLIPVRAEVREQKQYTISADSPDFRDQFVPGIREGYVAFAQIKPDGVVYKEKIVALFKAAGFDVYVGPLKKMTSEMVSEFYAVHKDKDFFKDGRLNEYMTQEPGVIPIFLVSETPDAIQKFRAVVPSIREQLETTSKLKNRIHGSDSIENALMETEIMFRRSEVRTPTLADIRAVMEPYLAETNPDRQKAMLADMVAHYGLSEADAGMLETIHDHAALDEAVRSGQLNMRVMVDLAEPSMIEPVSRNLSGHEEQHFPGVKIEEIMSYGRGVNGRPEGVKRVGNTTDILAMVDKITKKY